MISRVRHVYHAKATALITQRCLSTKIAWKVDPETGLVKSQHLSYQIIVGLEIHAQLNISTKLFSPAALPGLYTKANDHKCVHPFDVAVPGTLPVLAVDAVRSAILAAAALNCNIQTVSRFERKHYAYADLPAGYQITQQRWPLAVNGWIECNNIVDPNKKTKKSGKDLACIKCRINRIQLEQDTGKTITISVTQQEKTLIERTISRVDFSRAGVALIEIVTEPDLRSSTQAGAVVQTVRQLLKHTGSCMGKMEAGQLRVDCNVNLVSIDSSAAGHPHQRSPRVEVKNLNSIKQVQQAVNFEAVRQANMLARETSGEDMQNELNVSETRTWNAALSQTELIRRKDEEEDYRFMPEPDLPPIVLNEKILGDGMASVETFIQRNMPELPAQAIERLMSKYGLSNYQANVISADVAAIALFDNAMKVVKAAHVDIKTNQLKDFASTTANLLSNALFGIIKEKHQKTEVSDDDDIEHSVSMENSEVSGEQLGEIVLMMTEGCISNSMAKTLLSLLCNDEQCRGANPRQVSLDRDLRLVTDPDELKAICQKVISENPEEMNVYRQGGKFVSKMQKLFTGKAMAASRGNAHPERLQEILKECLEKAK
jgi:aspartyl-tRNA(Asn)/glutamyl-tRNA(Gln) amidotransferase subunit B